MTKTQLINAVANRTDTEKVVVEKIIETTITIIKEAMDVGESITIREFGTMKVVKRKAKKGRNISKNTSIDIPAKYIPVFKACKAFKARVTKVLENINNQPEQPNQTF